ncbi:MAG: hypothetical protein JO006_06130 [Paucibacter sp.]|nr:hypothetical protein [Roseateles sp.]
MRVSAYLQREGVALAPTQGVDNPAMVMSLVASMQGLALIPDYVENLLPWSVVRRPLAGEVPTIDLVVGWYVPVVDFFSADGYVQEAPTRTRSLKSASRGSVTS